MDRIATIELSDPGVVAAYAEIVAFTEIRCKPARPMTKNDLWIAAAARIAKASILTSDKDFDHLQPMGVQVVAYDTNTIRTKHS
jgi:predicted nucleic acid-binding protein